MEERSLRVLEFHLFLQGLQAFASSEVGQNLCRSLRPSARREEVEYRLREVSEAALLLEEEGELPLQGLEEIRPLLTQARAEGTSLPPESLLRIKSTAGAAKRTQDFLRRARVSRPILQGRQEEIPELEDLHESLHSAVGARGEILDSASLELRRIRREISLLRNRIRKSLEALWGRDDLRKIFQEQIITLRNERYVVAVKAENKNALPGIIHDQSQSRATFFIEPLSTLEENNELNLLLQDEKEEERRILLDLTSLVRGRAGELQRTVEVLGRLDLVLAKAKWGRAFRATIPSLNTDGCWSLRDARHPLLEPNAIPVDLQLARGRSTLIISGANAGGKTAALKTIGLLTLIAQSGVPIPAAMGSEVAVFGQIHADIGDEQNLRENLSTFSAWIRTLSKILQDSGPSSLVLLDEVGGGTDPVEGAALTMAVLDGLRAQGAKTVVTTHLHLLKAYGALNPDVLNVSVEFDPGTLRPTYRMIYGRPGESHALLMAEKAGLPEEFVRKAHGYLGEGERKVSELLQALERTQHEAEEKLRETEKLKAEAEDLRGEKEALLSQAREQRAKMISEVREESQAMLRQAREDLRGLINEFKARGRTDVHRLSGEIQSAEEKIGRWAGMKSGEDSPGAPETPPGTLAQLKEVFAAKSGKAKKAPPAGKRGSVDYRVPSASREVNVIGLRVEEAIPIVEKAIDDAFLGGLGELEVIHGAGTGRLRQAVRDLLHDHPLVKGFAPAGPGRGGDGATVVEIGPSPSNRPQRRQSPKMGRSAG
jgi:DNA mismatch repair protein MutS2